MSQMEHYSQRDKHLHILQQTIQNNEKFSQLDKCLLMSDQEHGGRGSPNIVLPKLIKNNPHKLKHITSSKDFTDPALQGSRSGHLIKNNIGVKKDNLYAIDIKKGNGNFQGNMGSPSKEGLGKIKGNILSLMQTRGIPAELPRR